MLFSILFHLYCGSQCTYHASKNSFDQYFAQYSFETNGCFTTKPSLKQRTVVKEECILSQRLSSILGKNIDRAGGLNHRSPILKPSMLPIELCGRGRTAIAYEENLPVAESFDLNQPAWTLWADLG